MRILIITLISFYGFAQNEAAKTQTSSDSKDYVSNFVVVDGNIIWRKVFGQTVSIKDYEKFLKLGSHLDNIEVSETDSVILGRLRSSKLSFVGFNENSLFNSNVPLFLKFLLVNGDIKIDIKNDKYRITIYNFKLIADATISFWQKGQEDKLDLYYYKPFSKNKYVRDSFKEYSEPIFNKNFIDKFQYKSMKSDF